MTGPALTHADQTRLLSALTLGRWQEDEPEAEPAEEVVTIEALSANVYAELNRRLGDPKSAAELPGTGLIQIAKELAKAMKPAEPDAAAVVPDVLDLIDHAGLPASRKRQLVETEMAVCEERLAQCRAILEGLDVDDAEAV